MYSAGPVRSGAEPVGALDDSGDFYAGVGVELVDDVAHVGFDTSGAEEQFVGDLAVGPASTMSRAIWSSRLVRAAVPAPVALEGCERRWMCWPSWRSSRSAASR